MLKSLELNGFKSFADRTRLEFSAGITAVVGPNGSGKSNVVDAIKWVLGNQSAKALRGNEMTDVIFSGSRSRKAANAAEVTLAFDNSTGVLNSDEPEVHVTRRVLRSGESEYLINRQVCRLRDIREVFSGIGVTTGAYSIIEQGRVDALLQSSPKERRLIFEEAAGVSRFKLKRQEAARRLERIDQNLLRLSDIVDELESRLRSVQSQAGKARKYKTHSDRLRELRIQVGLADWRGLSSSLSRLDQETQQLQSVVDQQHAAVSAREQQLLALDETAENLRQETAQAHQRATTVREQIAHSESTRRSQLGRIDELSEETERLQKQLLSMTTRAGSAQQLVSETRLELDTAEQQFAELDERLQHENTLLQQAQKTLAQCRHDIEQTRLQNSQAFRDATQLEHRIEAIEAKQNTAVTAGDRLRERVYHLRESKDRMSHEWSAARELLQQQETVAAQLQRECTILQQRIAVHREQLQISHSQLGEANARYQAAKERALVLQELERQLDGLSAGTKDILRAARTVPDGPFRAVRGIVADLLHVDADTAPLVEIALSERANYLVLEELTPNLVEMAETDWPGRTTFLRLDVQQPASAIDRIDLTGEPGVIGRADQFVEIAPDLAGLKKRLLGRHWFVDTLGTAFELARGLGRGLNYITLAGECLGADGTLTVGPRQSSNGLLSRRSELRALQSEIDEMQHSIRDQERICTELQQTLDEAEKSARSLGERHEKAAYSVNESRLKVASYRERLDRAEAEFNAAEADLRSNDQAATSTANELADLRSQLSHKQAEQTESQQALERLVEQSTSLDQRVEQLQPQVTDIRVALARSEQRRDGLRRQMEQFHRDHEEHDRALAETRQRAIDCRAQQQRLQSSVLELTSALAEWYAEKDQLTETLCQCQHQEDQLRSTRSAAHKEADGLRSQLLKNQTRLQEFELHFQKQGHQRKELAERLAEDYRIDLAVMAKTEPAVEVANREELEAEIRKLREQLSSLGPVSLDALTELETIEERYKSLSTQYQDLKNAKARLQQLVGNINAESRKIFVETLEIIRGHFQELYRSLFGGGEADIIVEDHETEDVLECGIEIIARPPGKQPRSISLLSGGERTMTCVALLLAIFRSRPTPFCVLDEVDAALDEANIDRFVEVLRQFMASVQFIVVTHSKRTMSCADTLYGVTMQESGVSKRVSVRFEDVSANGEIREPRQAA